MFGLRLSIWRRLARDQHGVTMVEYAIAAALMSAAIVTFLSDVADPDGLLGRIKLLLDSVLS